MLRVAWVVAVLGARSETRWPDVVVLSDDPYIVTVEEFVRSVQPGVLSNAVPDPKFDRHHRRSAPP